MSNAAPDAHRSTDSPGLPLPATVDPNTIYQRLQDYPFDSDTDYQQGLAAIFGHPDTPVSKDEISTSPDLVLQSECFYFARRFGIPPIDPAGYKTWLQGNNANSVPTQSSSESTKPLSEREPEEPPYPTSFAHIVDLITQNKPIPGIQEVPDTVLEPGSSKRDRVLRRKKPWETDDTDATADGSTANILRTEEIAPSSLGYNAVDDNGSENMGSVTGTSAGVVKILQPNAIPDSGLIAKD